MPFTITMPKLSPTMEEGTIVKWHVQEGQRVEPGQVLIEVATDKANLEYQALDGGYVRKILIEENASTKVNDPIAIFTNDLEESIEGYSPEGISQKEEAPVEETTTQETAFIPDAPPKGATLQQPAFAPAPPLPSYEFLPNIEPLKRIKASPLAKKIATQQGLDLASVKGTGPDGRILVRDLSGAQKSQVASLGIRRLPEEVAGSYEETSPTPMRKAIGRRLQESKSFIPHFYVHQDVNVSLLMSLRQQLKMFDTKLTVNDFVIKAVALALKAHPNINSGYNSVEETIVQFKTVDVSIAVTIPDGLITPIIRYADYKTIGEIAQEVRSLAKRAKEKNLLPEEYQGGSFTISNLGMFGVSDFVAIINPPQSAILSVAGIEEKPIVAKGTIETAQIMRITLSADHRIVDGVDGAMFIKTVQKFLENPAILLMNSPSSS
ncbi:MAG: pyruvate dehydrogenase complex dihydrolipoamide acetyltransferase [Chlamydiota bacterium]